MADLKENIIVVKSFKFALSIIDFAEILEARRRFDISNQVLKSGTSIGANIREAQNAESRADFIHKMKIAAKEAEETTYWLELCNQADNYPNCEELIKESNELLKILTRIIATAKQH